MSKRAIYESAVEAGFVGLIVFGFDRRWVVAIATWVVWLGYASSARGGHAVVTRRVHQAKRNTWPRRPIE